MDGLAGRKAGRVEEWKRGSVSGLAPGEAVEITERAWEIGRPDRWRTAVLPGRVSLAS